MKHFGLERILLRETNKSEVEIRNTDLDMILLIDQKIFMPTLEIQLNLKEYGHTFSMNTETEKKKNFTKGHKKKSRFEK